MKKAAEKKEHAEAPQVPRVFLREGGVFQKTTSHFFLKKLGFFAFFFTIVSIGKVHFSAKCLFGRIGGLKKF